MVDVQCPVLQYGITGLSSDTKLAAFVGSAQLQTIHRSQFRWLVCLRHAAQRRFVPLATGGIIWVQATGKIEGYDRTCRENRIGETAT